MASEEVENLGHPLESYRSIIREAINGFVFWSLFQGLGPMIWFYPLNELEISGYEVFAGMWFSPLLVGIPYVLQGLQNRWMLGILRLLSVATLASFQAPTTLQRLIILAVGAGISMLQLAATLWNPDPRIRSSTFWGLVLGWMTFITSRIWLTSFVPTWWSNQTNSVVMACGVIAALDNILSGADNQYLEKKIEESKRPYWFPTAIGFGSLLYLTHWCFGEVSLITRWVVKGYPSCGPSPYPWGCLVLIMIAMGIYMSPCQHMSQSRVWWICGCVSIAALYYLPTWQGFTARSDGSSDSHTALPVINKKKVSLSKFNVVLFLLTCAGLLGFAYRYDANRFKHSEKETPKEFSAMIWTYHFGYDNKGWPSLERSAQLINDTGADFVTLLESDASKPFLGNNDLGMWLGEKLGMYVDFGPATRDHTWGNLILSKYPIVNSTHHLLPSPHGELAPAITATINISGSLLDFVVTHMGNDRDVLDRELQAKFLARELKNSNNPVVFLGYVTSAPGSRDYRHLIKYGNVKDIDETDDNRWCEYIMYRGLIRLGYARITHGGLSDTEVQVARFKIPENPELFKDNSKVSTDPNKIDKNHHFNSRFGSFHYGHGYFKGHRFHMSTPKYFLP